MNEWSYLTAKVSRWSILREVPEGVMDHGIRHLRMLCSKKKNI